MILGGIAASAYIMASNPGLHLMGYSAIGLAVASICLGAVVLSLQGNRTTSAPAFASASGFGSLKLFFIMALGLGVVYTMGLPSSTSGFDLTRILLLSAAVFGLLAAWSLVKLIRSSCAFIFCFSVAIALCLTAVSNKPELLPKEYGAYFEKLDQARISGFLEELNTKRKTLSNLANHTLDFAKLL